MQADPSRSVTFSSFERITRRLSAVGLWAFPIAFRSTKKPLVEWKPYQDRAPTPSEIAQWGRLFGWASAGIPTGPAINLVVIDADTMEAAEALERRGMPDTWKVRTRRGMHFYFNYPKDVPVRNSAKQIMPEVDVRGIGGFVAGPGSAYYHLANRRWELFKYQWLRGPGDCQRADLPEWLIEEFRRRAAEKKVVLRPDCKPYCGETRPSLRKVFDLAINRLIDAPPGTRNDTAARWPAILGPWLEPARLSGIRR